MFGVYRIEEKGKEKGLGVKRKRKGGMIIRLDGEGGPNRLRLGINIRNQRGNTWILIGFFRVSKFSDHPKNISGFIRRKRGFAPGLMEGKRIGIEKRGKVNISRILFFVKFRCIF